MTNLAPKLVTLDETFSVPELNQRWITRMTGAEIAAHNAAAEPLNVLCIEDGSGFLNGHFYVIGDDGIIHDVFAEHLHTDTASGGSLYSIRRANYKNLIECDYSLNIPASAFKAAALSTGTMTDGVDTSGHTKYIQWLTAATSNDWTIGELGGGRLRFGAPITLQLKYSVSNNTFTNYRMGIATPRIGNAIGVAPQMGFEGCTGTDILNHAFSSDGTTYLADPMLDMVQAVPMGLRMDYYPSSKIIIDDGAGTHIIKTTNLPTVGTATDADNVLRVGIKTLTTATRNLKIYALRLLGDSYDSQSGVKGWV